MKRADYWIRKLKLIPHPEGGYFRETYRSTERIMTAGLPKRYSGSRHFSTAILFLLKKGQVSRLHRLKSDETWHFHAGSALTIHAISPAGRYKAFRLGGSPVRGEEFQITVKAGHWFGATIAGRGAFSLVGCTVAPGFEFADFEMADRRKLIGRYPRHRRVIEKLTV
jgi:uncharacterized protein